MYAPKGSPGSGLGDVEVVLRGDELHLFHLSLPDHDLVGHAVSKDGIAWTALPPALRIGAPGRFDDDQIWTVSVTEVGKRYHMLYTALSRGEAGRVQRVGLAVSDDLNTWERVGDGPVSEADPRLYETGAVTAPWTAWRDPKPIFLDGRYHVVVCARGRAGPGLRRGVVGHFVSNDFVTWSIEPPLFSPRQHFELECPQLFRVCDRLYLTAATLEERLQRYWTADSVHGPWRTPDDNRLAPEGHYAARVCQVGAEALLFCTHDVPALFDPATAWRDRVVPSPLRLEAGSDGSLSARPHRGWDAYRRGDASPLATDALRPAYDNPRARHDGASLSCEEGMELWRRADVPEDLLVQGPVPFDAAQLLLALGPTDDGAGVFVELDRGAAEARLVTWEPTTQRDGPWVSRRVLQRGHVELGDAPTISLRSVTGEVELTVDGRVVLSTVALAGPGLGVGVVSGHARIDGLTVTPMAAP